MDKINSEVVEYFKREDTQEKILTLATQIRHVFGTSWFTLEDCTKVFKQATITQLRDILGALQLCGFILSNKKKLVQRFRICNNQFKRVLNVTGE